MRERNPNASSHLPDTLAHTSKQRNLEEVYDHEKGVRERRFETADDFKQALINLGVTQAGIDNTIKLLTQKDSIVDEYFLTAESAKSLGGIDSRLKQQKKLPRHRPD